MIWIVFTGEARSARVPSVAHPSAGDHNEIAEFEFSASPYLCVRFVAVVRASPGNPNREQHYWQGNDVDDETREPADHRDFTKGRGRTLDATDRIAYIVDTRPLALEMEVWYVVGLTVAAANLIGTLRGIVGDIVTSRGKSRCCGGGSVRPDDENVLLMSGFLVERGRYVEVVCGAGGVFVGRGVAGRGQGVAAGSRGAGLAALRSWVAWPDCGAFSTGGVESSLGRC